MKPTRSLFMSSLAAWTCWCSSTALPMATFGTITLTGAAFAVAATLPDADNTLKNYGIEGLDNSNAEATITKVTAGSAAELAGLVDKDIVTLINDKVWKDDASLSTQLKFVKPKETVKLQVKRVAAPVTLIDLEYAAGYVQDMGLVLKKTIASDNSRELDATFGMAAEAGLRAKDEILAIDDVAASTVAQFNDRLSRQMLKSGKVKLTVRQKGNGNLIVEVTLPNSVAPTPSPILVRGVSGGTGPRVDFPEFIATGPKPADDLDTRRERENEVITARVETYYFRDAHRLAQIINRKIQSFNGAAVTAAERAAEASRGSFEKTRLDRRDKEDSARIEAEKLKELESRLASAVGTLRSALNKQAQVDQMTADLNTLEARVKALTDKQTQLAGLNPPQNLSAAESAELQQKSKEVTQAKADKKKLEDELKFMTGAASAAPSTGSATDVARQQVTQLLGDIQNQKTTLNTAQAAARKANDEEQLAAKDQFRKEVTAAKTDPDTYVPGEPKSADPVAQVSISVIGEGIVHLRGPRKGVVKVREMIDQLDHPVGQVKIGVMTVQVNGELGSRMENTLKRVEGSISRARFLTSTSGQLFLRAVHEVAHEMANSQPLGDRQKQFGTSPEGFLSSPPPQKQNLPDGGGVLKHQHEHHRRLTDHHPEGPDLKRQRWQRYVHAFFGADFIEELRDIDSDISLLDPENKLLALHSMDSLTLAEAMLLTGMAKAEVRDSILARFQHYICCELPVKEAQWIVTTGAYKNCDLKWRGDAAAGRAKTIEEAHRKYAFNSINGIFHRSLGWDGDRLNPMQHALVKLVQGISLELGLHQQRDAILAKRAMIDRLEANGRYPLTAAQKAILDGQIVELEERHLDAKEAIRGQKAAIDKLIKQSVIALEDDVYAQFYDPALERIRKAGAEWDVELAQIERTTIITNNRAFGKVTPQATYEFDLPKRDILLAEALQSAYALHKDIGPLLADPEFGTLAKMFAGQSVGGAATDGTIKNVLPSLNGPDQQNLLYADKQNPPSFTTELEKLIPDPAIYKFETGTGYEVRPVIQPDGQSVAFDFNYLYTTDLLEPVRANEKHLGRVKRHFINTEVQLGNLEWREISRYEVALKAARTGRGVPLLEDVPVAGLLFRPLPQAQKSIQRNVIIGQATIYPTIQDLLGLRPASQAYMDHQKVAADGYSEFKRENERFEQINRQLDIQMEAIMRGDCPKEAGTCPPRELRGPTTSKTSTTSIGAPSDDATSRTAFRSADDALLPRPVALPEIPAPAASTSVGIQQMSYQKAAAKVKSSVPAAPSAPRRVK